jgi:hypothetical protein
MCSLQRTRSQQTVLPSVAVTVQLLQKEWSRSVRVPYENDSGSNCSARKNSTSHEFPGKILFSILYFAMFWHRYPYKLLIAKGHENIYFGQMLFLRLRFQARYLEGNAQYYADVLGFIPQNVNTINEIQQILNFLSNLPLTTIATNAKAGDCLYSAIKVGLKLSIGLQEMRNHTSNYVAHHMADMWAPSERLGAPQDFIAYCQDINGLAYGDHYTLVALSHIFHFDYVVIRPDGSVTQSLFTYNHQVFLAYLPQAQHYILLQVKCLLRARF